ncbi:MAG: hypoxanthine phosphoribosyltransferase [Bauldia sp.]|nr:hypoxanthine phosphoribosyltransferase [Bauldia sp.]
MPVIRGRKVRVLFTAENIARRNAELATEIAAAGYRDLMVLSVLKGSFVFAADLVRALHGAGLSPEVDFMTLSSYGEGTVSSGKISLLKDIESALAGRDVLIVDDILETGRTLAFARDYLLSRGAARVGLAVMLDKSGKRKTAIDPDHVGFICPDYFVVGYGMDAAHAFRELPYVGVIED